MGGDRSAPGGEGHRGRQGHARSQRVRGGVGDAARFDDGRARRDARGAAAEAEPRGAVRLLSPARVLRHDHAASHAGVRHDRGAVRGDRGREPPARQPQSRSGHARQEDDAGGLPGLPGARRPAAHVRLVPHLGRRGGVRDHVDRPSPRPPPAAGGGGRRGGGHRDVGRPLEPAARLHVDPAGDRGAAGVQDGRARPGRCPGSTRPTSTC